MNKKYNTVICAIVRAGQADKHDGPTNVQGDVDLRIETNSQSPEDAKRRARWRVRLIWAGVFAIAGVAVCSWSWKHYRKEYNLAKPPVPVLDFIPTVPKEQEKAVMSAVAGGMSLMLFLSPEQREKAHEIWKTPPRSLEELISKQKQTDKILTPQQLERAKPVRRRIQGSIVDSMFEPGRKRFKPEEFDKMKDEIKRRVDERMSGE
jgi:hypothetical protein